MDFDEMSTLTNQMNKMELDKSEANWHCILSQSNA